MSQNLGLLQRILRQPRRNLLKYFAVILVAAGGAYYVYSITSNKSTTLSPQTTILSPRTTTAKCPCSNCHSGPRNIPSKYYFSTIDG